MFSRRTLVTSVVSVRRENIKFKISLKQFLGQE